MYAIIKTGGKQYKVAVGDTLKVEKLAAAAGDSVQLPTLMTGADAKFDFNAGGKTMVAATVLSHGRGEKIRVFKMKRRKDYRRTLGARQAYTEIKITAIGGAKTAAAQPAAAKPAAQAGAVKSTAKKSTAKKAAVKKSAAKSAAKA